MRELAHANVVTDGDFRKELLSRCMVIASVHSPAPTEKSSPTSRLTCYSFLLLAWLHAHQRDTVQQFKCISSRLRSGLPECFSTLQ
jgi:hypothetical protein